MRMETVSMLAYICERERDEGREHEIMELGEFVREKVKRKKFAFIFLHAPSGKFFVPHFFLSSFLNSYFIAR